MVAILLAWVNAWGAYPIHYEVSATANAGSGDFAPYYVASNTHGVTTQPYNALLRAKAWKPMTTDTRFSYGFGIDLIGGYGSQSTYSRYSSDDGAWQGHKERPAPFWIQQLYGEIKFRGVFLTVGLKERSSALLDSDLSSGDLVESGNARPMPEARAGFIDFQDIPFTDGWVQIQGEIGYGKATDNDWTENRYNYFDANYCTGRWNTYKRVYFRTKPSQPLSVTVGMQAAGQFSGTTYFYRNGNIRKIDKRPLKFRDFFDMLIPKSGDEAYYKGNHLGTWDLKARYRLNNGDELSGYFQWLWEDGSGIGKLNGFDGLWGIHYRKSSRGIVTGAVAEYLDFTNQSGPMHWDVEDNAGTDILGTATGGDNYYNNFNFNGYAHYGMSIGSPFLRSPLYNLNGRLQYLCNRVRGFHVGVEGNLSASVDYRVLFSYRKGWGTYNLPLAHPWEDSSMLVECNYAIPRIKGLNLKGQLAFDAGNMYGDNFGALITLSYRGILNIGKK